MTESTVTFAFIIGALCGALVIAMWLGSRLARVTTDRNRLQAVVDGLRAGEKSMVDMVARRTRDCVELQMLAHEAQDAHATTKRQLAAAKGQITKLKRITTNKGK